MCVGLETPGTRALYQLQGWTDPRQLSTVRKIKTSSVLGDLPSIELYALAQILTTVLPGVHYAPIFLMRNQRPGEIKK